MSRDPDRPGDEFRDELGSEAAEQTPDEPGEAGIAGLMNSFSLDSARPPRRRRGRTERDREHTETRQDRDRADEPALPPPDPPQPAEPESTSDAIPAQPAFDADWDDPATLVRPYTWTGGRTKSSLRLELETLVSSNEDEVAARPSLQREHRIIATLCRHPHSVAEVAAKLAVPLGVARVLLSDMAEQNLVSVHTSPADNDRTAHFTVMERVLSGLRRL